MPRFFQSADVVRVTGDTFWYAKYPYMIFLLQDFVQTNRINTKHMPKINHRLFSAIFIYKNPQFPRIFNLGGTDVS